MRGIGPLITAALHWAGCNGEPDSKPPGGPANPVPDAANPQDAGTFDDASHANISCADGISPEAQGLKINEVMFDPAGDDVGKEWVELFNRSGQSVSMKGYTISNRLGTPLLTLPDEVIPPCSYFAAHFNEESFDNTQDEVALYNGAPSAGTMIDFLAYSALGTFTGDVAFQYAKGDGLWQEGDFIDLSGETLDPEFVRIVPAEGDSIGRDENGTDSNSSKDWAPLGGANSFGPTPGTQNQISFLESAEVVDEIQPQRKRRWTFLVYMAGDNDLERVGYADISNFEKLPSMANVHIGLMADFATIDLNPKTRNKKETSAYVRIRQDSDERTLASEIQLIEEPNTGDAATLGRFLRWGQATLPADRYFLVVWGHGNGWKGTAIDYFNRVNMRENDNDRLTMEELGAGLADGPIFENMAFMSCVMGGIEVARQIQEKAKYMIASQEVTWSTHAGSWPWNTIVSKVVAEPAISAEALAKFTVIESNKFYGGFAKRTFAATKLEGDDFSTLISNLSTFAGNLQGGLEDWGRNKTVHDEVPDNVQRRIQEYIREGSFSLVESFPQVSLEPGSDSETDYRDLYELAKKIRDDNKIVAAWKEKVGDVMTGIDQVVVEHKHGSGHAKAHGLSIYFPQAHTQSEYAALGSEDLRSFDRPLSPGHTRRQIYAADNDPTAPAGHPLPAAVMRFTTDTQWDEFLHRYYNPVADASCRGASSCDVPVGQKMPLKGNGSSDSDGKIVKWCWDHDPTLNTDNGDFDKDNNDEADDDCYWKGKEPDPLCEAAQVYRIRLMVWDDHHTVKTETSGDHNPHYQVDDEEVQVACVQPQ